MIFHADSESDLKTRPNHVKNPILLKFLFFMKNRMAASAEGLVNKIDVMYTIESIPLSHSLHSLI